MRACDEASPCEHPFLRDGGHMAERIARYPWDGSPLGPIEAWPDSLKHTLSMMLVSTVPLVLLWGEAGVMLYNDAYAEFAGGRDSRLLGSNVLEGWDEVADFNANVMRVGLAGGTLSYRDHELTLHRNGRAEQVFMNLDYAPIRDELGEPAGVLAVVVETTEACLNRRALEESARKLAFLDGLGKTVSALVEPDAILMETTRLTGEHLALSNCAYADMDEDGDGFSIRGNWHRDGCPSIVGHYSLADFGTQAVTELNAGRPLILRDNRRELSPAAARTFQEIGISATICMPLVKDGKLIALMAIHDAQPRDWNSYDLEIIREVTERSWAHVERVGIEADLRALNETLEQRVDQRSRQLLQAEEALRHAYKMEAVGEMTGGLAHDFNNLLTVIGGAVDAIDARLTPEQRTDLDRYLSGANSSVRRAASITHRLLAFARKQTLAPQPTDVGILISDLQDLLQRTIGPEIALELDLAATPWIVCVDRNQLENAILNLCINARDAIEGGGVIGIAVANSAAGSDQNGEFVKISVSDTGHGMSPEVLQKAFDPFFTTKPMGKGTGLGLSTIYGFVQQSGGQIHMRSIEGSGTIVDIILPRHAEGEHFTPSAARAAEPDAAERAITVLVTEDEFLIRMLLVESLEDAGYTVIEAEDGPSALAVLAEVGEIDLLLTDVGLPNGMNGRQLADTARQTLPALKVLFITGYAEQSVASNAGLEPGSAILTKPFAMTALLEQVEQLLAR